MEVRIRKSVSCCPHCSDTLNESSEGLRCRSCGKEFPIAEGIPVLADAPVDASDSLSAGEISGLLERVEAHGWARGLRATLLQVQNAKGQAGLAEFADPRGVLGAMMVGGPHHSSVLCLGCSAGAVPFALAHRFARVTVCDLSLGRLRLLERRSAEEQYENLKFVCGGDTTHLPFPAREFDLILADATALPDVQLKAPSFWGEAARVLRPGGCCFVGAQNGRTPARLSTSVNGHLRSRFLTPGFLRKALCRAGFNCFETYGILPDNRTPHVLFDLSEGELCRTMEAVPTVRERVKSFCFHNVFFVPAFGVAAGKRKRKRKVRTCDSKPTFVQGIVLSAQEMLRDTIMRDSTLVARRIVVRRSGRVMIFANFEGKVNHSVVVKVPCIPLAEQRDERNAEALQLLHTSNVVPADVKRLVPRHLTKGSFGGQLYFVEEAIEGIGAGFRAEGRHGALKMSMAIRQEPKLPASAQVAEVLLKLQRATARRATMNERDLSPIRQALTSVRALTEGAKQQRVWDTIEDFLERELLGQQLPLVWAHGDAGGNFLQDRNGHLTGIIDWETFDENGLPLYDWVLLCISRRKREKDDVGWMSLRSALAGNTHVFFDGLPIENYLRMLDLDRKLIPALALSAWVQYAAHRVLKRGSDPGWVRRTVCEVLELLKKMLEF